MKTSVPFICFNQRLVRRFVWKHEDCDSQSEALRCNCGGMKYCSSPVETCYGPDPVCGSAIIFAPGTRPNYFKGCMTLQQCSIMNRPGISSVTCCKTDECNR